MKRAVLVPSLSLVLVVLAVLAGCNHPPRLDNETANKHREVYGPLTPRDNPDEVQGVLNGEIRGGLRKLAKLAREGDSIDVALAPGVFTLEDPVVVRGAKLVIRGPGADLSRIELRSDDWRALTVDGSPNVEIRGVTIAGYTGGGVDIHNSARVVVNEVDFAGSRYGLELDKCTVAYVDSCVFVGCEKAVMLEDTRLVIRGTTITECWTTLDGSGVIEALGLVLNGNVDGAAHIATRPGSRFRSCLFGKHETFSPVGSPDVRSSYMYDDLYERYNLAGDTDNNVVLHELNDFPDAVAPPRSGNLGAIHYALERSRTRGIKKPNDRIQDVLETEARKYAQAALRAVEKKDVSAARWLQQIALGYCQATGGRSDALRAQILGIVP